MELAREADGEVADVDPLLDLAERLGPDLAGLQGDQRGKVLLPLADGLADAPDQLAAPGRGDESPEAERLGVGPGGAVNVAGGRRADERQARAVDRRTGLEGLPTRPRGSQADARLVRLQPQPREDLRAVHE